MIYHSHDSCTCSACRWSYMHFFLIKLDGLVTPACVQEAIPLFFSNLMVQFPVNWMSRHFLAKEDLKYVFIYIYIFKWWQTIPCQEGMTLHIIFLEVQSMNIVGLPWFPIVQLLHGGLFSLLTFQYYQLAWSICVILSLWRDVWMKMWRVFFILMLLKNALNLQWFCYRNKYYLSLR